MKTKLGWEEGGLFQISLRLVCLPGQAVDKMLVDEMWVDEILVDETWVDKMKMKCW
jgi:hypothetical protein